MNLLRNMQMAYKIPGRAYNPAGDRLSLRSLLRASQDSYYFVFTNDDTGLQLRNDLSGTSAEGHCSAAGKTR